MAVFRALREATRAALSTDLYISTIIRDETGASKGIGAAIAKGLSAAGAAVVVNYSSSKEGADRVVAYIKSKGGQAIAVKGDVAKAADMRRLMLIRYSPFAATQGPLRYRCSAGDFWYAWKYSRLE